MLVTKHIQALALKRRADVTKSLKRVSVASQKDSVLIEIKNMLLESGIPPVKQPFATVYLSCCENNPRVTSISHHAAHFTCNSQDKTRLFFQCRTR